MLAISHITMEDKRQENQHVPSTLLKQQVQGRGEQRHTANIVVKYFHVFTQTHIHYYIYTLYMYIYTYFYIYVLHIHTQTHPEKIII